MTGGTRAGVSTDEDTVQARWNRYYTARDLAATASIFREIMTPPHGVPQVSTRNLPPSQTLLLPMGDVTRVEKANIHKPVDNRPASERRANKKRYRKAKAYFGKTFIVTRAEIAWATVLWIGSVLLNSALLFLFFNHLGSR